MLYFLAALQYIWTNHTVYGGTEPPFSEEMNFPSLIEFTEKTPLQLAKFEIRIKRIVEQIFLDYALPMGEATSGPASTERQHELEVVILRLPMQFGPRYRYAGNPISIACHVAAGKVTDLASQTGYMNAPVPVLWNIFGVLRPLYIKDTASAFKTVLEAPNLPRKIYNLHSGFTNSPRQQYQAVLKSNSTETKDLNIPLEALNDMEIEVGFNCNRMSEDFGWESSYTLESAIQEYVDWLGEHSV